jgi:hypothetical protein
VKNLVAGRVDQVVEELPRKCKALNSNPSTTKKKKKNSRWLIPGGRNSIHKMPGRFVEHQKLWRDILARTIKQEKKIKRI